jgi:phosphoglycolate phosphatase-like HAD superfamily hydrolase
LLQYFPIVVCPDNTNAHKPDPEPARFGINALLDVEMRATLSHQSALGKVEKYVTTPISVEDLERTWFIGDALPDMLCGVRCFAFSCLSVCFISSHLFQEKLVV